MRGLVTATSLLAAACGAQAPVADAPRPPPSASAPATATTAAPPVDVEDPRVVRCGIDDRPRSVSETSPPSDREEVPRGLLGAPPPTGRRAPPEPFGDVAPPMEVGPRIELERLPPASAPGTPLAPGVAEALATRNPQYDVCAPLVGPTDVGTHAHRLELATTGVPLRVVSDAAPTKLERCLMERSCQLRAATGPAVAMLAVAVRRTEPPPPQPPPDSLRPVAVEVKTDPREIPPSVERILTIFGGRCATTAKAEPGTSVRLFVTQRRGPDPRTNHLEGAPGRPKPMRPPDAFVTTVKTVGRTGPQAAALGSCVETQLARVRADLSAPLRVTITAK